MKKFFIQLITYIVICVMPILGACQILQFDTTFSVGQGFDGPVYSIEVDQNGKVLIGGAFNHFNNIPCSKIVRLNLDGSIDNSFTSPITPLIDPNTHRDLSNVQKIKTTPNGQILVSGANLFFIDSTVLGLGTIYTNFTRLNPNGSVDVAFTNNFFSQTYGAIGIAPGPAYDFILQNDGSIIFSLLSGIVKVDNGGTAIFSNCGFPAIYSYIGPFNPSSVTNYNGNSIYGGAVTLMELNNTNITAFGVFDSIGSAGNTYARKNRVQFDNSLCVTNSNHHLDSLVATTCQLGTTSYFIGGRFSTYDQNVANQAAIVDANGNMDNTFVLSRNLVSNGVVSSLPLNNKLLLGIDGGSYQGTTLSPLAIFNVDGTYDAINSSSLNPNASVMTLAHDFINQYIYCGGEFLTFNGNNTPRIARLKIAPNGLQEISSDKLLTYQQSGVFYIQPKGFDISELFLYDVAGREILKTSRISNADIFSAKIPTGYYILQWKSIEGNVLSRKISIL